MAKVPENSIVREFEYKIAEYCGSKHCLSVSNATIGILGVFYALGLSNAEVITTPLTWCGAFSGLQILNCKFKFCDIEPENLTINPDLIESLITPNTKAVFSADFLGYPARLDRIKEICTKHNLLLIHDAASSFGSRYNDLYSGFYADVTILSFGAKKIFSLGEGGCILMESDEKFEQITKKLMHPLRQKVECCDYNPFALNSNINPFAAKYAIDNLDLKMKEIEANRKKNIIWLKNNLAIESRPIDAPNFYRIVVPIKYLIEVECNYSIEDFPFDNLIYNEPGYGSSFNGENYSCPLAESAINQYKIISIQR